MVRGDALHRRRARRAVRAPAAAAAAARLVLVGERASRLPADGRGACATTTASAARDGEGRRLRIAHPLDLLARGDWPTVAARRASTERRRSRSSRSSASCTSPTKPEQADGAQSAPLRRPAGQARPGAGAVRRPRLGRRPRGRSRKTFHDARARRRACRSCTTAGPPAEVEGLTLEAVRFRTRGECKPMPLADVPPRLFSEVMRDLDLVVSVAHVGGVDPEAQRSPPSRCARRWCARPARCWASTTYDVEEPRA